MGSSFLSILLLALPGEKSDEILLRHRRGVVKALDHVRTAVLEIVGQGLALHALHHHALAQAMEQCQQRPEHQLCPVVLRHVEHQASV